MGVSEWLADVITNLDPSPKTALDLGSGVGDKSIWLTKHGYDVTGIDVSPVAIRQAKTARGAGLNPCFVTGDLARLGELGLKPRSFGLILDLISSQFLGEADQTPLFKTIRILLSKKGVFVHTRLEATGKNAPDWVKRIPELTSLTLKNFQVEEHSTRNSSNLPDVTIHKYLLR